MRVLRLLLVVVVAFVLVYANKHMAFHKIHYHKKKQYREEHVRGKTAAHTRFTLASNTLYTHASLAHIRCHKLLTHTLHTHPTHTHSYIISLALLSVFGKTFSRFFECGKRTKRKRKQTKRKKKRKENGNVQEFNLA